MLSIGTKVPFNAILESFDKVLVALFDFLFENYITRYCLNPRISFISIVSIVIYLLKNYSGIFACIDKKLFLSAD